MNSSMKSKISNIEALFGEKWKRFSKAFLSWRILDLTKFSGQDSSNFKSPTAPHFPPFPHTIPKHNNLRALILSYLTYPFQISGGKSLKGFPFRFSNRLTGEGGSILISVFPLVLSS